MKMSAIIIITFNIDLARDYVSLIHVHVAHSLMLVVCMACLVDEVLDVTPDTVNLMTSSGVACVEPKYLHQKSHLA